MRWTIALYLITASAHAGVDYGATLPWVKLEAEAAKTNAEIVAPSRQYLTPASEASGRSYVRLDQQQDSIEFTVSARANTCVLRFSIPDSADGRGTETSLSIYLNGEALEPIQLTSKHAWVYGNFPWTNDPIAGRGHKFWDEVRVKIPKVNVGDQITFTVTEGDISPYYLIDFIELELAPDPLPQPVGSLSLLDFGASPNDDTDDTPALLRALAKAESTQKILWIPPGDFKLNGERIELGQVDIQGAGMWHSTFSGSRPMFEGTGKRVRVADLAISGETNYRDDNSPDNAFNGNLGEDSLFESLWIEHLKCAFWTNHGTRRLSLRNSRIRNVMADGLNFCDGTTGSVVENSHFRNTGDDALATWSPSGEWSSQQACLNNRFSRNTVELPWHANAIGIYGGGGHIVENNKLIGTVTSGAGILVSSGFGSVPFSDSITVRNNQIQSTGGECYIGEPVGGIWIHLKNSDIAPELIFEGNTVRDSAASGISVHGPHAAAKIIFKATTIDGANDAALKIFPSAKGLLTLHDFAAHNYVGNTIVNLSQNTFTVKRESTLVWSDEFNGEELDFTKWAVEENGHGGGNNELQYYLDRPENVRVEDGHLIIEAHKEALNIAGVQKEYSSGRIRTKRRASWKYGRFEVRAQLPKGRGLLPAIWMLPENEKYGGWAASGEIDIAELVGHEPSTIHGTIHHGGGWPRNERSGQSYALPEGTFADDFHTFAIEWSVESIRWYVDDILYHEATKWKSEGGAFPAPFDQPFHMIINLAVGGNWPGHPDYTAEFPAQLKVDYVRVFAR